MLNNILNKSIEDLKEFNLKLKNLFNIELHVHTYEDFLFLYPKKYIRLFILKNISELIKHQNIYNNIIVQIIGKITNIEEIDCKNKKGKILIARLEDHTGFIQLVWFHSVFFMKKKIQKNILITVSGKIKCYQKKIQIIHPNIQKFQKIEKKYTICPIYHIPKKLQKNGIDNSFMIKILKKIIKESKNEIEDIFTNKYIKEKLNIERKEALTQIHFPESLDKLTKAKYFLKFEELFFFKLILLSIQNRKKNSYEKSYSFSRIGKKFNTFYKYFLPFSLTEEQKKVFKEIRFDLKKSIQMNRLLQGDVGCGKTIIAILAMLLAIDNGVQSCLMVPTEILAIQHYLSIQKMFSKIGIKIALLTRSTSLKKKKNIYHDVLTGKISIIIGTHSLIQDSVNFKKLGLAIIDEQQRFGVEQREKIWKKNKKLPHILVMTATPIPRTLALILYKDLNLSIIKEFPINRKPIKTIHCFDKNRFKAFEIIQNQIKKGRQIYIVYPTINPTIKKYKKDENEYKNLTKGYEFIKKNFQYLENKIGILHGKMSYEEKNIQMNLFFRGETKIMVSTTVIEVGIDIPNASVILIENADYFGLSQLHQLRGRVGRGPHQSYCILMTDEKIGKIGSFRIKVMCETNNGLEIAKRDLTLRGSGDIIGTKQSGKSIFFKIADLVKDFSLIKEAISIAKKFFYENPDFVLNEQMKKNHFYKYYKSFLEKNKKMKI
ncbi:ATP-dependent DNA helicase RecG [Blattabacterium cuenoti]|uniref:ATP-dependent DNA helicase RecG n=1 Tax=Blattabacterium cuenoti TaxID=1653831 RepID=UPI00163C50C2|nr:ATP-dependent DNA helicase RecG [Blattabacterium cuenoti]